MEGVAGLLVRRLVSAGRAAIVAAVVVLAVGSALPAVSVAGWRQPVPSPLNVDPAKDATDPIIANIDGVPYVVWQESSASGIAQVRVSRLMGDGWSAVGGSLNVDSTKPATSPGIRSVGGVAYVAWSESNGSRNQLRVKRLTGGGWSEVGGSLNVNPGSGAGAPSITSIDGVPYVAWHESNGIAFQIRVKRFTGGGWSAVGGSLNIDVSRSALDPRIADIGGVPYVAWEENNESGVPQIWVKRFSGGEWTAVGGALNVDPARLALYPSVTSIGGVPYVAWSEDSPFGMHIQVKRFTGGQWSMVGGSLSIDQGVGGQYPSITSIGEVPYVAWYEYDGVAWKVRVKRFAWGEWSAVGRPLNLDPTKMPGRPGITSIGGVPYVAWHEYVGIANQVRVARLEPDFLQNTVVTTDTSALLITTVRDYGVALPIAFQYGKGASLRSQTAVHRTSGTGCYTLFAEVGGLTPNTRYSWRPFASDTLRHTALGPTGTFTTRRKPAPAPLILIAFKANVTRALVTVHYALTGPAKLQLSVKPPRGKPIVVARSDGRVGIGKLVWNRRLRGKRAKPGTYRLTITATRNGKRVHSAVIVKLR